MAGDPIVFSRGRDKYDNKPRTLTAADFAEFVQRLDNDRCKSKGLQWFSGPFNGAGRCEDGAQPRRFLPIDIDAMPAGIAPDVSLWLMRFVGVAWPTHSSTPEAPKLRAVLELDREATRTECVRIGAALVHAMQEDFAGQLSIDDTAFRSEQPQYCAPVGVKFARFEGEPLIVDDWLALAPEIEETVSRLAKLEGAFADDPVLAHLNARELVREIARDGKVWIHCPFESEHTGEAARFGTSYFVAHTHGFKAGHFKCLHAHCADRKDAEFLEAIEYTPTITPELIKQQRQQSKDIGELGEPIRDLPDVLSIDEMIARFVYIEESQQVAPIEHPQRWLSWPAFRAAYKASFTDVQGDNGRKQRVQNSDAWLASPMRRRAYTLTFRPGAGTFTRSPDDHESLNLWRARPINAPDNWRELAAPFVDHVRYMIPDEDEGGRFLDWLAHIEQHPGVLPHAHYLMVAKTHGIGRNWLAGALARVWPGHVALNLNLHKDLLGSFNHSLSRKLLAVIDELHEGAASSADVYRSAEQLKAELTSETRTINNKYGPKITEFNCCRFLMLSNHGAALPITESDRRVVVIENPHKPRAADYYVKLYQMHQDRGFAESVRRYLAERDVSKFNPGAPAPMSDAKRKMIQISKSELDMALEEIRETWKSDCIRAGRILELAGFDPTDKTSAKAVKFAAQAHDFERYPRKVRTSFGTAAVYIIRNHFRWLNEKDARRVAADIEQGETAANCS